MNHNLSEDQKRDLAAIYWEVIEQEDCNHCAGGAHYFLIHALNRVGIYPGGTIEAKQICEDILFGASDAEMADASQT